MVGDNDQRMKLVEPIKYVNDFKRQGERALLE